MKIWKVELLIKDPLIPEQNVNAFKRDITICLLRDFDIDVQEVKVEEVYRG